jgi:D-alanyl-lipoteichoic acid acyltransferase DltB (MBOAT superfamily)
MQFNSLDFAVFLPLIFSLYWLIPAKRIRLQNVLLLVASYVFYGWWDWRFLSLIACSTVVDYSIANFLGRSTHERKRKVLVFSSVVINLGLLGYFKYYNFFIDTFVEAFSLFGIAFSPRSLNIILPVGISFYTFQTLSYTIDVYRRKLEPTLDLIAFSSFVSFFPQLVAGPIERASSLLPQFFERRTFNYGQAVNGMRQILWGLFKKIVIADNCAVFANYIFDNSADLNGSSLVVGALFFTFQIYGDFSGYSDIAIGTSRLFGFKLKQNFAFPYFSRDIAEFWRRWHISLSTWFRDYLYIPLGGSRGSTGLKIRNTAIIFLVSGFWHGANWTFVVWGALHAMYFIPLLLSQRNRTHLDVVSQGRRWPRLKELVAVSLTFTLTVFAWIFFRAENLAHAWSYVGEICSSSIFAMPAFPGMARAAITAVLVFGFVIIEWQGRAHQYAIADFGRRWIRPLRWTFYAFLIVLIGMYMPSVESPFIYFQF